MGGGKWIKCKDSHAKTNGAESPRHRCKVEKEKSRETENRGITQKKRRWEERWGGGLRRFFATSLQGIGGEKKGHTGPERTHTYIATKR